MGNDTYSQYTTHPLRDVPQRVLDAAREVMQSGAQWKDVDPDMAEPLADSVVQAIVEAGYRFDLEDCK